MSNDEYSLAIETSHRTGSIALGRGDVLLDARSLGDPQRHAVGLMPGIDAACKELGIGPRNLSEVYVSIGPGSFTGLRIGVTTAKMLARVTGCRIVAVPTLDVVVRNAPVDRAVVAVCLNAKGGRCFTGVFDRSGDDWAPRSAAALLTPGELCESVPESFAMIADKMPEYHWPNRVEWLGASLSVPRSMELWALGRERAKAGEFADAMKLTPLYVRLPDAEELWRKRHGES